MEKIVKLTSIILTLVILITLIVNYFNPFINDNTLLLSAIVGWMIVLRNEFRNQTKK